MAIFLSFVNGVVVGIVLILSIVHVRRNVMRCKRCTQTRSTCGCIGGPR